MKLHSGHILAGHATPGIPCWALLFFVRPKKSNKRKGGAAKAGPRRPGRAGGIAHDFLYD